ncbi:MAG: STAS domain-containing protein [Candidatus Glassbacteria bacterium]|nr:STAS domain-containing protein [Candidatus Glassbacteria bacterium]
MAEKFEVTVHREPSYAVIYTDGYINNVGGEKIAEECYKLLDQGIKRLILNLAKSPIVNSVGIAVLIELIERVREDGEKIVFCNCTPVIAKTFKIMGLTQYAEIQSDEQNALAAITA